MALIRWEPVAELNAIQSEMNRLFNTFFESPGQRPQDFGARRWIPAMDLVETDDHYILLADLPGLTEADVSIQLEDGVLTISGQRRPEHEQEGYHRLERAFGSFARSLTLPDGIDAGDIRAHLERGVLELRIPKPEQRRPRRVAITVGGQAEERGDSQALDAGERPARQPELAEAAAR
ncbi:MAG TPA: Hsp20/alpha crystallin family protein [Solirubrobacteraceae bacterium]|nr:Hsp20/alpha crystallin family protein [Solirubrobacteraceae bacterium]